MYYINALELINTCIQHDILKEKDGCVLVYRTASANSKEGWYLCDKDLVAKELMNDAEGQQILIDALKKKNVEFTPTDYAGLFNMINGK